MSNAKEATSPDAKEAKRKADRAELRANMVAAFQEAITDEKGMARENRRFSLLYSKDMGAEDTKDTRRRPFPLHYADVAEAIRMVHAHTNEVPSSDDESVKFVTSSEKKIATTSKVRLMYRFPKSPPPTDVTCFVLGGTDAAKRFLEQTRLKREWLQTTMSGSGEEAKTVRFAPAAFYKNCLSLSILPALSFVPSPLLMGPRGAIRQLLLAQAPKAEQMIEAKEVRLLQQPSSHEVKFVSVEPPSVSDSLGISELFDHEQPQKLKAFEDIVKKYRWSQARLSGESARSLRPHQEEIDRQTIARHLPRKGMAASIAVSVGLAADSHIAIPTTTHSQFFLDEVQRAKGYLEEERLLQLVRENAVGFPGPEWRAKWETKGPYLFMVPPLTRADETQNCVIHLLLENLYNVFWEKGSVFYSPLYRCAAIGLFPTSVPNLGERWFRVNSGGRISLSAPSLFPKNIKAPQAIYREKVLSEDQFRAMIITAPNMLGLWRHETRLGKAYPSDLYVHSVFTEEQEQTWAGDMILKGQPESGALRETVQRHTCWSVVRSTHEVKFEQFFFRPVKVRGVVTSLAETMDSRAQVSLKEAGPLADLALALVDSPELLQKVTAASSSSTSSSSSSSTSSVSTKTFRSTSSLPTSPGAVHILDCSWNWLTSKYTNPKELPSYNLAAVQEAKGEMKKLPTYDLAFDDEATGEKKEALTEAVADFSSAVIQQIIRTSLITESGRWASPESVFVFNMSGMLHYRRHEMVMWLVLSILAHKEAPWNVHHTAVQFYTLEWMGQTICFLTTSVKVDPWNFYHVGIWKRFWIEGKTKTEDKHLAFETVTFPI